MLLFSRQIMSDFAQPQGLKHTSIPCPRCVQAYTEFVLKKFCPPSLWFIDPALTGLPWWLRGKEFALIAGESGDVGLTPRSGRSPGEGNAAHFSIMCFSCGSDGQESPCNAGDPCSIPAGRSPWVENGTHSSILVWRIPIDRGAWQAAAIVSQRVEHDWATNTLIMCFHLFNLLLLPLHWASITMSRIFRSIFCFRTFIASGVILKSFINFELSFVYIVRQSSSLFFFFWTHESSVFPTPYTKRTALSPCNSCLLCCKLIDCICLGLFLALYLFKLIYVTT